MNGDLTGSNQNDARLLLQELADIKEVLRETSRQLLRIERRIKASFPVVAAGSSRIGRSVAEKKAQLDEHTVQQVIAGLKERVSKGEQIEAYLRNYRVKPDLQLVARVLGMTNAKLPPKDELVRRISTRLRQSVSVTTGFHEETTTFKNDSEKVP